MNTSFVMTASAVVMGIVGIVLTFAPDLVVARLGIETTRTSIFVAQLLGALYFAFAMLNWMSKANLIGGIYNRPVAVANLTHFLIAGLALVKGVISNPDLPYVIWAAALIYALFGLLFGIILFRHPVKSE